MDGGRGMWMGGGSLEAEDTQVSAGARQGKDSGAAAQPVGVAGRCDMPRALGGH